MDFGERNSHCQLSVHSADKSRCAIAALVMLANKGAAARAGDRWQRGHHLPEPPACFASLQHWLSKSNGEPGLERSAHCHPLCTPKSAGLGGRPPLLLPSPAAVDVLRPFCTTCPAQEGTEVGLCIEAVAVSMLPWFWSRMEEEQKG